MKFTSFLSKLFLVAALLTAGHYRVEAATPISFLGEQADLILVGEATAMSSTEINVVDFEVRADFVLKGDIPAGSSVETTLRGLNEGMVTDGHIVVPSPLPQMYGFWFLKQAGDGSYSSIPRYAGTYYTEGAVIRLPKSWVPLIGIDLDRVLLSGVKESYRHSDSDESLVRAGEPVFSERLLTNSLQWASRNGSRDLALEVVADLMNSSSARDRSIGIITGIELSYDPAMSRLVSDLESIRLDEKTMGRILFAMGTQYDPNSPQALASLASLIPENQRAAVEGLDMAIARSLHKINGKEMLPLAALLLDSGDPEAVRQAAHTFYMYSVLALRDSSISKDGTGGPKPFRTEETLAHSGRNKKMSAAENAEFWREWWDEKQADIAARATF